MTKKVFIMDHISYLTLHFITNHFNLIFIVITLHRPGCLKANYFFPWVKI